MSRIYGPQIKYLSARHSAALGTGHRVPRREPAVSIGPHLLPARPIAVAVPAAWLVVPDPVVPPSGLLFRHGPGPADVVGVGAAAVGDRDEITPVRSYMPHHHQNIRDSQPNQRQTWIE